MRADLDIWELIKASNEQAFSELFRRYSSKIYSKAYFLIKDREVCEQIVHDIFLTLWSNRTTLEIRSLKAYLTSASRYQVYKYLISNKTAILDYKDNLEELSIKTVSNIGHDNIAYKELEQALESYLSSLPNRCREIFMMSRHQLLSNEEIAQKLNISKRSVENQITHALRHLRISLKEASILLVIFVYLTIT